MTYANNKWIMVREPPVATNINQMEEEEEEEEAQQDLAHQWNPFESLVIQKMDAILHHHQEHQAEAPISLENITTRLENIETRLSISNLLNPNVDEA